MSVLTLTGGGGGAHSTLAGTGTEAGPAAAPTLYRFDYDLNLKVWGQSEVVYEAGAVFLPYVPDQSGTRFFPSGAPVMIDPARFGYTRIMCRVEAVRPPDIEAGDGTLLAGGVGFGSAADGYHARIGSGYENGNCSVFRSRRIGGAETVGTSSTGSFAPAGPGPHDLLLNVDPHAKLVSVQRRSHGAASFSNNGGWAYSDDSEATGRLLLVHYNDVNTLQQASSTRIHSLSVAVENPDGFARGFSVRGGGLVTRMSWGQR